MITLGIETSCDETACAVVQESNILSSVISSSVPLHEKYGGVIPEIASRFHIEYINQVVRKALKKAKKKISAAKLIAVTAEPGLPGSLITGKSYARALSYSLGIPLIEVDHLIAHLFANFLDRKENDIDFPFVGVVVSGGHTNIFVARSFKDFEIIGKTKDDAVGEAFDKIARILGIGYPGGPRIEKYAKKGSPKSSVKLPRVYLENDSFDFSLSGVKTAVFYYTKNKKISKRDIAAVAWAFQEAVFDVLVERVARACKKFAIKTVLLGGGVISNKRLCDKLTVACAKSGVKLFYPPPALCVDNAAMVAGLGERLYRESK